MLFRSALSRRPNLRGHLAVVTGDPQQPAIEEVSRTTGCRVLGKPFRIEQLRRLVQELLDGGGDQAVANSS